MRRLIILVSLAACGEEDALERAYVDVGQLCIGRGSTEFGYAVDANQPLQVEVRVASCLSSGCDKDRELRCEATVEGDRITIASTLRWTHLRRGDCANDVCVGPRATCSIPRLPAGSYTVKFGASEQVLQVPSVGRPCSP